MKKDDEKQGNKKELGRRDFLRFTGAAVGGALTMGANIRSKKNARQVTIARKKHHKHRTPPQSVTAASSLVKFVDALPIPGGISHSGFSTEFLSSM